MRIKRELVISYWLLVIGILINSTLFADGSGFFYDFKNSFEPRRANWVYESLSRLCTKAGISFPNALPLSNSEIDFLLSILRIKVTDEFDMQVIEAVDEELLKERRALSIDEKNGSFFMGLDIRGDGWYVNQNGSGKAFTGCFTPWVEIELGSVFFGYNKTTVFTQHGDEITLPLYDPVINPDFILHNWEERRVMGNVNLEVKADKAYCVFNFPWLVLEMGRDMVRWGPGYRGTLFLSGFSQPLDFLYNVRSKIGPFSFYVFNAGIQDSLEWKRISAQRIEICLWDRIRLGLSEGILHTKEDLLKYFNPLGLYYIPERRGRSGEDNMIAVGDVTIIPWDGIKLYCEVLDDDIVTDKDQPSLYAIVGGFQLAGSRYEVRVEGTYVNRWTYAHRSGITHWTYGGIPLGFWAGNDVIDIYCGVTGYLSPYQGFRLSFEHLAHGVGNVEVSWEGDKPTFPGHPRELKSPSGCVDRRNIVGLEVFWRAPKFSFNTGLWWSSIKNYNNEVNRSVNRLRVKVVVDIFL